MDEKLQTQPQIHKISACPICASANLESIMQIPQLPILSNVLWDRREDALAAPLGDVHLAFCMTCGHVFNQAFNPAALDYHVPYENSLHFSPHFQKYATSLARHLVDQYDLHGKSIVEIGSGKGDFLRLVCEYGGNVGTGFDPSYEPAPEDAHPAVTLIRDIYSERYATYQADLIISRHVLEHLYQPAEFAASLRRAIGDRPGAVVFIEVPNFAYMLRDTAIWDIIYEHFSYFSPQSLSELFTRSGFTILSLGDAYAGQFLYIEAQSGAARGTRSPAPEIPPLSTLWNEAVRFAARGQAKRMLWNEQLSRMRDAGQRVVIWGAGSKGITFLNMLDACEEIDYIVDLNPRKWNRFVTGSGQRIVAPEFIQTYRPDTIIVMNPIYQHEIHALVNQLGLKAELILAS